MEETTTRKQINKKRHYERNDNRKTGLQETKSIKSNIVTKTTTINEMTTKSGAIHKTTLLWKRQRKEMNMEKLRINKKTTK